MVQRYEIKSICKINVIQMLNGLSVTLLYISNLTCSIFVFILILRIIIA